MKVHVTMARGADPAQADAVASLLDDVNERRMKAFGIVSGSVRSDSDVERIRRMAGVQSLEVDGEKRAT